MAESASRPGPTRDVPGQVAREVAGEVVLLAPGGETLAAALRAHLPNRSWSEVRRLCTSGKVLVNDDVMVEPARRLRGGERITIRMNARNPNKRNPEGFRVLHEDGHIIVIEKPEGFSSVPFDRKETNTALDLIRGHWRLHGRRATVSPLYTVHRIDKDTSGILCFAKTRLGERGLHNIFQQHRALRTYIAVAHGFMPPGRIESRIIPDRGDGLRGSLRPHHARNHEQAQVAITHVSVQERLPQATVCEVRLETGRTHQIRIHLAEQGHPIVGETVYIRDLLRAEIQPLPSSRLLLHAASLGFQHPVTGDALFFEAPLPPGFAAEVDSLRRMRTP